MISFKKIKKERENQIHTKIEPEDQDHSSEDEQEEIDFLQEKPLDKVQPNELLPGLKNSRQMDEEAEEFSQPQVRRGTPINVEEGNNFKVDLKRLPKVDCSYKIEADFANPDVSQLFSVPRGPILTPVAQINLNTLLGCAYIAIISAQGNQFVPTSDLIKILLCDPMRDEDHSRD